MSLIRVFLILSLTTISALAQNPPGPPQVAEGPVNAASYGPAGLPNSGIARGGLFIVKGANLGTCGTIVGRVFPLPANMSGTSMKVTVGATAVDVVMVYVVACRTGVPDQLAGILPSNTPIGAGQLTVTYNARTSQAVPIQVVESSFGIFTINQAGTGPGIFTDAQFNVKTLTTAAHSGDQLIIWGTGLGPISGSDASQPPVGDLPAPVEVYIGNQRATVSYHGRSGCCAGLDQILVRVPENVQGCYVPVTVRVGGVTSNSNTLPVAASNSQVCSDPTGFSVSDLRTAEGSPRIGIIPLARITPRVRYPSLGTLQGSVDTGEGHFFRYLPGALFGSIAGSVAGVNGWPSVGSCFVSSSAFYSLLDSGLPVNEDYIPRATLDAGAAITVNGPKGAKRLLRLGTAIEGIDYFAAENLGGGVFGLPELTAPLPPYLEPGIYTVDNGTGGADVGPFRASLTIPAAPATWNNMESFTNIPRGQDLTVTWTGGEAGAPVMIYGTSANVSAKSVGQFACVERASAGRFTVPNWIVSALPVSGLSEGVPVGYLGVATALAQPARFQATGLDMGFFSWTNLSVTNVNYQ